MYQYDVCMWYVHTTYIQVQYKKYYIYYMHVMYVPAVYVLSLTIVIVMALVQLLLIWNGRIGPPPIFCISFLQY